MRFDFVALLCTGIIVHPSVESVSMNYCSISCRDVNGATPAPVSGNFVSGPPGKRGPAGQKGERGSIGPRGPKGMTGPRGVPGQSCACGEYETNLNELRTELQFVRHLALSDWQRMDNGRWYRIFKTKVIYAVAKRNCARIGAQLAAAGLRNQSIRRELYNFFKFNTFTWIGLNDINQEGQFMWIDNVSASSANTDWQIGQPDDYLGGEDCCMIRPKREGWNDWDCLQEAYYLCETNVI